MDKVLLILVLGLIIFYTVYPLVNPPMDKCPHCDGGMVYDGQYDKWFYCDVCDGSGVRSNG